MDVMLLRLEPETVLWIDLVFFVVTVLFQVEIDHLVQHVVQRTWFFVLVGRDINVYSLLPELGKVPQLV